MLTGIAGFVTDGFVAAATNSDDRWHLRVFDARTGKFVWSQDFPGKVVFRSFAAHHESRTFAVVLGESYSSREAKVLVFGIE